MTTPDLTYEGEGIVTWSYTHPRKEESWPASN